MADQRRLLPDDELIVALGALSETLAWPAPTLTPHGPDLATRVRARIAAAPPARAPRGRWSWWPARRALILAGAALLALAAVATAVGLGVPGIRLIFGDPSTIPASTATTGASPSASVRPAGSDVGLGAAVALEDLETRAGFPIRIPGDPVVGPPDAAYLNAQDQASLVWAPTDELAATANPRIGLLLTQFEGRVRSGTIGKTIGEGTSVEPVTVGAGRGFWISGAVHLFFYETLSGAIVEESRRWVGDALIWSDGDISYRLETSLGREAAIRIAESLR